jgi:hypothetical protein
MENQTQQQDQPVADQAQEKKVYVAPQLTVLGSLADLTQGSLSAGAGDAIFSSFS